MKKYTEKAQDYFERHPSSNDCHITSDGRVFHTLGAAQGFAGTLDNQEIESYKRSVLENESQKDDAGEKDDVFKTPAGEIAMNVFLENSDVATLKYDDLKKLAKHFNIETADQKAETLIAALTEYKNTLNQA